METESFAMGDCYLSSFVPSFKAFFAASCTLLTVSLYLPSVLESTNSPALSMAASTLSMLFSTVCANKSLALSRNAMLLLPLQPSAAACLSIVRESRVVRQSPPWIQIRGRGGIYPLTRLWHGHLDLGFFGGGQQPLDRFGPWMRRQPERAPVDRNQKPAVDVQVPLDRLLGIHVNIRPRLAVRTDRHQRHVEGSVVGADVGKTLGVAGVSAEVRPVCRTDDRP